METVKTMRIAVVAYLLLLCSISIVAQNHELSQHITKLSEWSGQADVEDYVPEMEIVGQNIHTIWVRHVSGSEGYLYYRRSTDLGKTWEAPKLIHTYTNPDWAKSFDHRKLAVEGEKVYIATADYNYQDNGTSRIYFYESVNAGANFAAGRVLSQNEGGYRHFYNSLIKVKNGKIAIAYQGETSGIRKGTWFLYSSNGGASFTDTRISEESSGLSDLFFDGNQAIVLHNYTFFNNGLHTGRVWVSTTTDGTTFTTNKISPKYTATSGESEKCLSRQFENYSAKIAKSGNNIVVVFEGNISEGVYTILYARSTNNGLTFEGAKDLNKGVARIETPKETVAAANGNFYIAYQSYGKNYKFYFSKLTDNGATFSQPITLMPTDIAHVGYSNLPNIVIDPLDQTGKTFYITGNWFYSIKSADGGNSFSHYQMLAPSLKSVMYDLSYGNCSSWMKVDSNGQKHWISRALYRFDKISDISYRNIKHQPEPGKINKSFYVETTKKDEYKLDQIVVPDNTTIRVDSAMTTELWIRFRTGNDNEYNITSSIFTKLNGPAGYYDNTPDGYHLAFRKEKNLIQLNSGLKTDKGSFVNWSDIDLNDNLWHHVAITYDARAGKNNYKIYINGILNKQQTVTGKVYEDVGMLILGSSNMTDSPRQIKYDIDNFRLWNKALTQNEIIVNQTAKLTGKEEGLLLFLNFDDTYKDLTGRGNDAIPVYDGRLEQSDFNPPIADFDIYADINKVILTNKSQNSSSYSWNFGNEKTSLLENPAYTYPNPGEYKVALTAKNSNSAASRLKPVTIGGLDRIEPASAGNGGMVSISVFGGGLTTEGTNFILRKKGKNDISGIKLSNPDPGKLCAFFNLNGQELGKWDVVVVKNGAEQILKEAFTIEEAGQAEPWLSVSGRSTVLFNRWFTYTLDFGNNGNADAYGVPLIMAISDIEGLEVELIDFGVQYTDAEKLAMKKILDAKENDYFIWDNYFDDGSSARVYAFIIPRIETKSTESFHVRIKSPTDFEFESWISSPIYETSSATEKSQLIINDDWADEATKLNACITLSAMDMVTGIGTDVAGLVLPIGCLYDVATAIWNPWEAAKPGDYKRDVWDFVDGFSWAVLSCAGEAAENITGLKLMIAGAKIMKSIYDGYNRTQKCHELYDPLYKNKKKVRAVSSFDPNEMIGPSGYGDQNWIQKTNLIPYTVLFENKSSATAPAHDVFVTDTLDLSAFDLKEFGFGAFGFGDTILSPNGNKLKKFAMDVDLRPAKNLITRVSGNLDTITGVVKWEFISLNPTTMELEEDPFIGFLPPNNTEHAGEGFVSFYVGLKDGLGTNDQIKNQATIVFDANKPILTNQFVNTIDMDLPVSKVDPLDGTSGNRLNLKWSGSDGGSGIGSYSVYYLENDTLLAPVIANTTETSTLFVANVGSKYKFYSIATDNVSLTEDDPSGYDASTHVTVDVKEFSDRKGEIQIFPNPVKEEMNVMLPDASEGVYLVELIDMKGKSCFSNIYESRSISRGIKIKTEQFCPGLYLVRVVFGNSSETRKIRISNKPEK